MRIEKINEEEIRLVRETINGHLDQLQAKIINKLCKAEMNANNLTEELLKSLEVKEPEVMKMASEVS